VKHNKQV